MDWAVTSLHSVVIYVRISTLILLILETHKSLDSNWNFEKIHKQNIKTVSINKDHITPHGYFVYKHFHFNK